MKKNAKIVGLISLFAVVTVIGSIKYSEIKKKEKERKEQAIKKEKKYKKSVKWAIDQIRDPLSIVKKTTSFQIGDVDMYRVTTKKSCERIDVVMDWNIYDSISSCVLFSERWQDRGILCHQKDKKILEKILLK